MKPSEAKPEPSLSADAFYMACACGGIDYVHETGAYEVTGITASQATAAELRSKREYLPRRGC